MIFPLSALLAFATALVPSTSGAISDNWVGYVQPDGFYTSVGAEWTIPVLVCPAKGVTEVADWVGVNGWGANADIFQAGTISECSNGVQTNWGFWTDQYNNDVAQPVLEVATGDVVYARVWQRASGYWSYSVRDTTSKASSSAPEPSAYGRGVTAETIAEDPANMALDKPFTLADFGKTTFSHVTPSLVGARAVAMIPPDGIPLAMPGDPVSSTFQVTFN